MSQTDIGKSPHSKKVIGLCALIALLLLLFFLGWFPRLAQWRDIQTRANDDPPLQVIAMQVRADKKPIELILPSTTEALRFTPIWARTDGYIKDFLVDIGDYVTIGQLLAEIETPEVDKQLLQARAELETAQANLEFARISAKRWQDLYTRNRQAVSKQEVDERSSSLQANEATVKSFEANVQHLEKLQGFQKIYAPFDGRIVERNIDLGTLITAGSSGNPQQLYQIADMSVIRVFVKVPQYFYRLIKNGLETEVFIQEFPNKVFKGVVVRNSGALDPVARTLLTQINIDNSAGELIAGLYADVKFSMIPQQAYFIIPIQALIIRDAGPLVAVIDQNQTITLREVSLGRDWGKTIEITTGLQENDRIIVNPTEKVKTGVTVDIIEERPPIESYSTPQVL